jgi:large subunit ribosomal protein L4e
MAQKEFIQGVPRNNWLFNGNGIRFKGAFFHWLFADRIGRLILGYWGLPFVVLGILRKINKKEVRMAINSAFAATTNEDYILRRYSRLSKLHIKLPIVVESKLDGIKTKQVMELIEKLFGNLTDSLNIRKKVRAGRGKMRGRKYKSNAGILFIIGTDEKLKTGDVEVKKVSDVEISDLYPLGRLTIYTEKALQELAHGEKK